MGERKDLLSSLESVKLGVAPAGAKLPHELRDTSPPPMGAVTSKEREAFQRWWNAQQEIHFSGYIDLGGVGTIEFTRPVMVNRKFTKFLTVVFNGRLDGKMVGSGTRSEAMAQHERFMRRLVQPEARQ